MLEMLAGLQLTVVAFEVAQVCASAAYQRWRWAAAVPLSALLSTLASCLYT
jgi:hypothetical protein